MPVLDALAYVCLFGAAVAFAFTRAPHSARVALGLSVAALAVSANAAWALHWQAAGALVLSALLLVVSTVLLRSRSSDRRPRVGAGLAALTVAALAPYYFFPIFQLPAPDGEYRVGVRTFDLQDDARRGVLYTPENEARRFPVTVWYPANVEARARTRPFLTRQEALVEGVSASTNWGFPAFLWAALHAVRTHSVQGAPAAEGAFPVVIYSHGYWSFRAQNTSLMERLASHGYIVVSVAHPRDGANALLSDGSVIATADHFGPDGVGVPELDDALDQTTTAFMGGEDHAARIAAIPAYNAAVDAHRLGVSMREWRADVLFAARSLREAPPSAVADVFGQADFTRVAYAGMSFGGSTATSACDADEHCVAAVDLDGENFDGRLFNHAVHAPLLLILTDQPFSSAQGTDGSYNPTDYAWEEWRCVGARADIVRLRARGMLHMGLSDMNMGARDPFRAEHFGTLNAQRATALVNDTTLSFLDAYVRGAGVPQFEETLARYPEFERLNTASLRAYAAEAGGEAGCAGEVH